MTAEFDTLYEIFKMTGVSRFSIDRVDKPNPAAIPLADWLADICIAQADKVFGGRNSFAAYCDSMDEFRKKQPLLWKKYDYLCGPVHHDLAHGLARDDPLGDHKVLSIGTQLLIKVILDRLTCGALAADGDYRWEYILKEFPDAKPQITNLLGATQT